MAIFTTDVTSGWQGSGREAVRTTNVTVPAPIGPATITSIVVNGNNNVLTIDMTSADLSDMWETSGGVTFVVDSTKYSYRAGTDYTADRDDPYTLRMRSSLSTLATALLGSPTSVLLRLDDGNGDVFDGSGQVTVYDGNGATTTQTLSYPMWLFLRDPFVQTDRTLSSAFGGGTLTYAALPPTGFVFRPLDFVPAATKAKSGFTYRIGGTDYTFSPAQGNIDAAWSKPIGSGVELHRLLRAATRGADNQPFTLTLFLSSFLPVSVYDGNTPLFLRSLI